MGTMSIKVSEELSEPTASGKIGGTKNSDTNCKSTFTVYVSTDSAVDVTWSGGFAVFIVEDPNGSGATNGETVSEATQYKLTINGYKSYDEQRNNEQRAVTFFIHDQSGNLVDSKAFNRTATNNYC
jgi:hypothetical protein